VFDYILFICLYLTTGMSHLEVNPRLLIPLVCNTPYPTCTYSRLAEDEPSGSKHVEDIVKIRILV